MRIEEYSSKSNSSYIINESIGIFIKYSTKRMTPWVFTFSDEHVAEILYMKDNLARVFLILVCHNDGIVCLDFDEFNIVVDYVHKGGGRIRIQRNSREKYMVVGSGNELPKKIGDNEFPKKIFT